ncbi:MAG: amidohydrolase family protein [Roseibium sp.]
MIIDSHQHFWALAGGDYPWPNESVAEIFRDFGPEDLEPLIKATGITKTVLVQATDTIEETEFLLDIAARTDWIAGVVGWVDLGSPDAINTIDQLRTNPLLVGIRPILQNISQTDWILQGHIAPVLVHLAEHNLCFDALIQPRHLNVIDELARRVPSLKIVLDHSAKPAMAAGQTPDPEWVTGMCRLAERDNDSCKLSGLVTEIGPEWMLSDIQPFAELVLTRFGAQKVMFGSDWPVVNLASNYVKWFETTCMLVQHLLPEDQQSVFSGTARSVYGLQQGSG